MLRNEAATSKIKLMRPLILKPKIFHTLGAVFVDWLLLCGVKETGSAFKKIKIINYKLRQRKDRNRHATVQNRALRSIYIGLQDKNCMANSK